MPGRREVSASWRVLPLFCRNSSAAINAAEDEVGAERVEDLEDRGDVVHQREVDGLELGPEREAAVGDDEGVGVPHARQQAEHGGIEDAGFEHDRGEKGTSCRGGYKP